MAKAVQRQVTSVGGRIVRQACERIRNASPPGRRRPRARPQTPLDAKIEWLRGKIPEPLWTEQARQNTTPNEQPRGLTWNQALKSLQEDSWERYWTAYLQAIPAGRPRTVAQSDTRRKRSELYVDLSKPMSALITQIRTEKIGLNGFLTERRVPGYLPDCPCGWSRQTAKHIILNCPRYEDRRLDLFALAGTRDFRKMLATSRGAKAAASFL